MDPDERPVLDPEDEPEIPEELDLRGDAPLARLVRRIRKESGARRIALKKEKAERAALEGKLAALEAAGKAPPAPRSGDPPAGPASTPPDVEERLQAALHRAAVAEVTADAGILHPAARTARSLLMTTTVVNSHAMRSSGKPMAPAEIALKTGMNIDSARHLLRKLKDAGRVTQPATGREGIAVALVRAGRG